jgi:hypothetical protein
MLLVQQARMKRPCNYWWGAMITLAFIVPPSKSFSVQRSLLERRTLHVTTAQHNAVTTLDGRGPLSLTLEELANVLGGKGRAQACWDCYRLGVDPAWFYAQGGDNSGDDDDEQLEPIESILLESLNPHGATSIKRWSRSQIQQELITPRRQSQRMGRHALEKLQQAFSSPEADTLTNETHTDAMSSIARIVNVHRSLDGTTKLLLQLTTKGGQFQIESVIIPWRDRGSSSLCLSNQVGCAQACTFCSTGRMGELRSLTSDEILVQMYWAAKVCRIVPDLYPVDAIGASVRASMRKKW